MFKYYYCAFLHLICRSYEIGPIHKIMLHPAPVGVTTHPVGVLVMVTPVQANLDPWSESLVFPTHPRSLTIELMEVQPLEQGRHGESLWEVVVELLKIW